MMHNNPPETLYQLVGQMGLAVTGGPERLHQTLEDSLAPLVRTALRYGLGQPVLVAWVKEQLLERETPGRAELTQVSRLTSELTHKLAGLLTTRRRRTEAAETVVGV